MSLDVALYNTNKKTIYCPHCAKEIMVEEKEEGVYGANITHNLNRMAMACGIYEVLWRPEEINITEASQLIEPLSEGLRKLKGNPDYYKTFDSPNGWGLYIHFVPFVENYLNACIEYPEAKISVSR